MPKEERPDLTKKVHEVPHKPGVYLMRDRFNRAKDLGPEQLPPGHYRLKFGTGDYYAGLGTATFFPEVDLVFEVTGAEHYHVPLLLSPFAYSTYRGS